MSLLKKIIVPVLFLLAMLLMVELSYRVFVIGSQTFNWRKVNSMTTMMRSEFVQPAENPEIFFELKPSKSGWLKGMYFSTNTAGLADKDYALEKPENALRVAVVGSSWTMPTGVLQENAWHSLIEEELTALRPERPVEFVNFAVEMYGLKEIVGTLKYKVPEWQPDLVLVAITSFTTAFIWEDSTVDQQLPPRANPVLQSFAYASLAKKLGWEEGNPAMDRPLLGVDDFEPRLAQVQRALRDIAAWRQETNVPVAIVFLGFVPLGDEYETPINALAEELSLDLIYANRVFGDAPDFIDFQVSRFDRHPNSEGHEIIADFVQDELLEKQYLPIIAQP